MTTPFQRYLFVFFITLLLFAGAFWVSNRASQGKIAQLQAMQQEISLDILSTETRFALLGATSCDYAVSPDDFEKDLSLEVNELARRVKFLESELGPNNQTVLQVKEQYNLFQIKDYLLRRNISDRCGETIISLLYFHERDCKECQRQTFVLDELHSRYPEIRTYWFDRDLQTPAMQTLLALFKVTQAPTIIIGNQKIEDLATVEQLEQYLPEELVKGKKKQDDIELDQISE